VREASCYNWKQDLFPFPKIETSMEIKSLLTSSWESSSSSGAADFATRFWVDLTYSNGHWVPIKQQHVPLLWVPRWWMQWCNQQPCQTPITRKQFSTRRKIWNSSNEEGDWRHDNWHPNSNSTTNRVIQNTAPENHQFGWYLNWVSSCLSFFLSGSTCCYISFHCSYLYNYYN
jgi:hypothetical protein